jgi:tRNA(Ile)-lysidine synthase
MIVTGGAMPLADQFVAALEKLRLPAGKVVVAVSGGLDSVVLLDLLAETRARHQLDLVVAHVDHGILTDSGAVARRVERLAREAGLPFESVALALGPDTTETRARASRYRALRRIARRQAARFILTAHHRDDQRETVLMRFLHGSGPSGLTGMRARTRDLARPLLSVPRSEILEYARARGLAWAEDPSNVDPRHLRSWIRHAALPLLQQRLPALPENLDRVRRQAATHQQALDQLLRHWSELEFRRDARRVSLSLEALLTLPLALRLTVVAALVRAASGPAGGNRIQRALRAIETGRSGLTADLGEHWRLETAFGRLVVVPPAPAGTPSPAVISGPVGATTWGDWRISWSEEVAPGRQSRVSDRAWFAIRDLSVRAPQAGDRLEPLGGVGRRLAVRCFQDARIPRSDRAGWPVIEAGGAIAWIPGVCRSAHFCPESGEPAIRIHVQRAS